MGADVLGIAVQKINTAFQCALCRQEPAVNLDAVAAHDAYVCVPQAQLLRRSYMVFIRVEEQTAASGKQADHD